LARDLTIVLRDRPGELARLGEATGRAGVSLQLVNPAFGGMKLVIATDDTDSARAALA
jgi:hypothetical protein